MTKEEILAMEAGAELDKIVGEEVFGLEVKDFWPDEPKPSDYSYHMRVPCAGPEYKEAWEPMPHYSTNISAAWQVVEKMVSSGYAFCFDWESGKVATVIRCIFEENFSKTESEESEWADGETGPEAICKAALLAKLDQEKK